MATTPTTTQTGPVVRVSVAGEVRTYPDLAERYAYHTGGGGAVASLQKALTSAAATLESAKDWALSVLCWAYLDDAPLAYLIEVYPGGAYKILGAARTAGAPMQACYLA